MMAPIFSRMALQSGSISRCSRLWTASSRMISI
jgi:hypothetical protein